jgi:ribosomal protein S18 acetylase RimI-like enzyme
MSSFQIRPATMRDAKAIAELHASAAQATLHGLVPEAQIQALATAAAMEKRLAYWREAIEFLDPQVHVAADEAQVIGFVAFDRSRDAKTPATTGEIWALYVEPGHWDQGVGLALWDAAREGLVDEGCTKVTAWLSLHNDRALRFFDLAGFKREMGTAQTVTKADAMGNLKLEEIRLKRALD